MRIQIDNAGNVRYLAPVATSNELERGLGELGQAETHRASVIEPAGVMRRVAFRVLRRLCGDGGRAAAWTRRWGGRWRARVIGGPELGKYDTRKQAIRAEMAWFAGRNLK